MTCEEDAAGDSDLDRDGGKAETGMQPLAAGQAGVLAGAMAGAMAREEVMALEGAMALAGIRNSNRALKIKHSCIEKQVTVFQYKGNQCSKEQYPQNQKINCCIPVRYQ